MNNPITAIPKDEGTKIWFESEIVLRDTSCYVQLWSWDGLNGTSFIFDMTDHDHYGLEGLIERLAEFDDKCRIPSSHKASRDGLFYFINYV